MNDILVESVSPFIGIGQLIVMVVIAWGLYHILRLYKQHSDKEGAYNSVEINALGEMVERTKPELMKWAKLNEALNKKNFRKRLEEQLIQDFFEKQKKDEKK